MIVMGKEAPGAIVWGRAKPEMRARVEGRRGRRARRRVVGCIVFEVVAEVVWMWEMGGGDG